MHTHKDGLETWWDIALEDGKYCRVFVWKDKYKLMSAAKIEDACGYCVHFPWIRWTDGNYAGKKFAEIHLPIDLMGAGIAAHEIQHLVNYWSEYKGWSYVDNDEDVARFAGEFTRDFWDCYYKRYEKDI